MNENFLAPILKFVFFVISYEKILGLKKKFDWAIGRDTVFPLLSETKLNSIPLSLRLRLS
jgi:hypothetical protein